MALVTCGLSGIGSAIAQRMYNRTGVEYVMGFLHSGQPEGKEICAGEILIIREEYERLGLRQRQGLDLEGYVFCQFEIEKR